MPRPDTDPTPMEARILLAFALNRTRSMTCAELMAAAAVCRRPMDEAPAFEAAVLGMVERGTAVLFRTAVGGWRVPGVLVAADARLPVLTAAAIRRRMGVDRRDEDGPRRLLAIPGPQLADISFCGPL